MKINKPFIKLSVVSFLFTTVLLANSNLRGSLKSGEEIAITPKNQHALSITRTPGMYMSSSSFDFIMTNHRDLVYEDKNQIDDIHLVFHDDIEQGDLIKIHINRGYFDYKIVPINALPNIVKSVLDDEVLERAKVAQKRAKKPKRKVKPKKTVKKEPKITLPKKEEVLPVATVVPKEVIVENSLPTVQSPSVQQSSSVQQSPLSEGFFDKFTEIFQDLVKSFAMTPSVKKESKEIVDTSPKAKEIAKEFDDSALQKAATTRQSIFTSQKRGLQTSFEDSALQSSAGLEKRTFTQAQRGIRESFDDRALKAGAYDEKRVFNRVDEIPENTYVPAVAEGKFGGAGSAEANSYHSQLPKQADTVPSFRGVAPVIVSSIEAPKVESIPTFKPAPQMAPVVEEVPTPLFQGRVYRESEPAAPVEAYASPKEDAYPDTGYKKGYESLDNRPRVAIQERVVEDVSLTNTPVVSEGDEEKKLVITKTIDRQAPIEDPCAGRVLGSMDDRILGNGYDGALSSGKLGMKVTKNSRPVSAWIEVFKNGTKERVKTFYTAKGRSVKSVKLPAGTYMVRATYRTRGSKQQKTIKNIRLKEGGSVNKSIAFHDGKLRVISRRGDKAMYVKVVAYKSGTRDRVSYDFSSRTSGIAELALASGRYDIEVIDHANTRSFDSIHITGGKTNTINADF